MVDQHMLIREIKEYANSNNIPIMLDDGINFLTTFILKHQFISSTKSNATLANDGQKYD